MCVCWVFLLRFKKKVRRLGDVVGWFVLRFRNIRRFF